MGLWSDIVRRGTTGETRKEDTLLGTMGVLTYDDCEFVGMFAQTNDKTTISILPYNINLKRFYYAGRFPIGVDNIRAATEEEIKMWRNTVGSFYDIRHNMTRPELLKRFDELYKMPVDIITDMITER